MIPPTPWTERNFRFDFPVSHFPVILERLRGVYPRLVHLTAGMPERLLEVKDGTRWSVKEHIGHLTDLEALHEARLIQYREGQAVLQAADMTNRATEQAGHNAVPLADLLEAFHRTRQVFVRHLETLDVPILSRSATHPRLKQPMRLVDMIFFVAEHDDHHLTFMRNGIDRMRPAGPGVLSASA
jgi:hypothetical protein